MSKAAHPLESHQFSQHRELRTVRVHGAALVQQVIDYLLRVQDDYLRSERVQANQVTWNTKLRRQRRAQVKNVPYVSFHFVNVIHADLGWKSRAFPTNSLPGGPGGNGRDLRR